MNIQFTWENRLERYATIVPYRWIIILGYVVMNLFEVVTHFQVGALRDQLGNVVQTLHEISEIIHFYIIYLVCQFHLGFTTSAKRYIAGGTDTDPMVVMNAALTSSGVLISPCITLEMEVSINLSTVVSIGLMIRGIAASPTSVGRNWWSLPACLPLRE